MFLFVDESIHDRGNFIVTAAVCASPDQILQATEALSECGFIPGLNEFKSSMKMDGNEKAQELRERFRWIIGRCKIAIGICAIAERPHLGQIIADLCKAIAENHGTQQAKVYLDEGIGTNGVILPTGFDLEADCDSKDIIGIQLADCCAHFLSTIILDELGIAKKWVPASRVYPGSDHDLELAWELWASIRYALAGSGYAGGTDSFGDPEPVLRPFGLVFYQHIRDTAIHCRGHVAQCLSS